MGNVSMKYRRYIPGKISDFYVLQGGFCCCCSFPNLPFKKKIPVAASVSDYIFIGNSSWQTDVCTPMFIAALLSLAKMWEKPECPSTDEWINKMWYVQTIEYYSATNGKEILTFTTMKLEDIMPSEITHHTKGKNTVWFHLYEVPVGFA